MARGVQIYRFCQNWDPHDRCCGDYYNNSRADGVAILTRISAIFVISAKINNSDSCIPLSKQIIQMAEDFEFDGILKLADALDAC